MKAAPFFLLALGLLTATPVAGQAIVCGGVRLPLAPGLPAVRDTAVKRVADSIPCIKTNGTPSTQLRNRLSLRSDSLSRRVPKVDTILVPVTVVDTIYLPLPVPEDTLPPIILPPDPPTGEVFDSVLAGTYLADVVVPDGKVYKVGADVRIRGNLRTVGGKVVFRPGSNLTFLGADPNRYVGGGMMYAPEFANDIGAWIGTDGTLDVQCTAKETWNRSGANSSWLSTDELWSAPVASGDFTAHRYTLGQPVPRADSLVPPTEVVNVTRDCSVTGPGHIHIHSTKPQTIRNLALVGMGVSNVASRGPVLGRYALHMHMSGDGSRGSQISGVVSIGAHGNAYFIHASHGVSMSDNAAVNTWGQCFGWDLGQDTNDITVDHFACIGVQMPDSVGGGQSNVPGISLPSGQRMEIRNSVVAGVRGGSQATGFDWPEPTALFGANPKLVWIFDQGNVAHNNRGPGVRFWTNNQDAHVVADYTSYRNGGGCVENGAYFSRTVYRAFRCFEDGYIVGNDLSVLPAAFHQNASNTETLPGDGGALTDCNLMSPTGVALDVGHRQLPSTHPLQIVRCVFTPGPGKPKILVGQADNPWFADIIQSGVTPADIEFVADPDNEGSVIRIDVDGDPMDEKPWEWIVTYLNGQKKVSTP